MSPRPKKATDDQVFEGAVRVMVRRGPTELTLADIATEVGLTAGALVQRFGSKRGLLLALMERFAGSSGAMFASLRATDPSPLAAIYAYAHCMARMGETPDALAHHLGWLQQDLTDPDFRRLTVMQALATRRELQRLVAEAVKAGELQQTIAPARVARAIEVTVGGSLMAWAVHQKGTAKSWVHHDLDAVLRPLMRKSRRPRAKR
ncbi:MAG: TetR/AcrR family transcriptional regulator [Acidobacteria bacterium]|nr:TetR/AcrR family transcriptional regulator [Acidobacteriota bacterium]